MLSQTGLTVLYVGAYAWFVLGFVLIAFPAAKEICSMLFKKTPADKEK